LQRELESFHTNEFSITAVAGGAGAYDLSGTMATDLLSGRRPPNPFYVAYLLAAYQEVYHLAFTFSNLLATNYQSVLPPLFQGTTRGSAISAILPAQPLTILEPAILADFRTNNTSRLRRALLHILEHRDGVWLTRPRDICAHIESLPAGIVPGS
jgi:hypothetical protein